MTVGELIAKLQKMDPATLVVIAAYNDQHGGNDYNETPEIETGGMWSRDSWHQGTVLYGSDAKGTPCVVLS
jgi:hypothetical protein